MALVNNFNEAGKGFVISYEVSNRVYTVGSENVNATYTEVTTSSVTVWHNLTYSAALAQVTLCPQPTGRDESATWSMELDSRETGSYTVTQSYTKTVTTEAP